MSKVVDIDQNEYSKILSDHLSSFHKNSSVQDFENSFKKGGAIDNVIKTLEERLQNHQKFFLQYQSDLLNIRNSYQEQDNIIFGSREAIDAEINRNQKDSYELNKILTGLKTLSNTVLENKQDTQKSINRFRANVGTVPEVQPNIFKRAQTFFKNLFTDNQKKQQNIASENLKNFVSSTFVKSDEVKAPMYVKVANFIANNPERMKEVQEKMVNSKNMNPNFPPIPTTPPPPLPPEIEAFRQQQANANKVPIPSTLPPPLPTERQTVTNKIFDVPPPSDIPPSPNIGEKGSENLKNELRSIAAKFGLDIKGRVVDDWDITEKVSSDKNTKAPLAPPPPPIVKSSRGNVKGQATNIPSQKGSDTKEDKETTKGVIKDPESFDKFKNEIKKGVRLKKAQDKTNPLDQGEFKYIKIEKSTNQLETMFGKEYEYDKLIIDKPREQQMNVLYSAVVGGLTKVVKELMDKTIEINTGKTIDDEWGDRQPVMETKQLFSKEDVQKVYSAAKSLTAGKEGISYTQKIKIEKSVEEVGKKLGIETEGKGRG